MTFKSPPKPKTPNIKPASNTVQAAMMKAEAGRRIALAKRKHK